MGFETLIGVLGFMGTLLLVLVGLYRMLAGVLNAVRVEADT